MCVYKEQLRIVKTKQIYIWFTYIMIGEDRLSNLLVLVCWVVSRKGITVVIVEIVTSFWVLKIQNINCQHSIYTAPQIYLNCLHNTEFIFSHPLILPLSSKFILRSLMVNLLICDNMVILIPFPLYLPFLHVCKMWLFRVHTCG